MENSHVEIPLCSPVQCHVRRWGGESFSLFALHASTKLVEKEEFDRCRSLRCQPFHYTLKYIDFEIFTNVPPVNWFDKAYGCHKSRKTCMAIVVSMPFHLAGLKFKLLTKMVVI